ncbi:hypothetical protein M8J75_012203 [Diaphorina citri]|nr:hypothetical protein M8J75_012203 [Diaphorina citri]
MRLIYKKGNFNVLKTKTSSIPDKLFRSNMFDVGYSNIHSFNKKTILIHDSGRFRSIKAELNFSGLDLFNKKIKQEHKEGNQNSKKEANTAIRNLAEKAFGEIDDLIQDGLVKDGFQKIETMSKKGDQEPTTSYGFLISADCDETDKVQCPGFLRDTRFE